ncbi:MAG: hypothetical protein IJE23_03605 [Tyzzerella sp.]|nr:hypothetical protein [Tyzzerella sp.]
MNQTTEYQEYPRENREHKSTLFCKVFENKEHLLDLYNCVNNTAYKNADDLEVNTLENVVYITMKNDLSFLIDCNMNLYEQQSTFNPNMPLRGLLYFAQLYNKYIAKHNINLYSSAVQKIPVPKYIVFYNGTKEQPDEQILLLSDLFQKQNVHQHVDGCLECEARMLNINYGKNRELLENCRRLEEYCIFVAKVREYATADIENRELAIIRAIDECIEAGILADILIEQKAEVLELMLTTFNKELYEQGLKEEGAREADERIVALEQQNEVLQNSVAEKDAEIAEKDAEIARLKAQLGVNE